MGMFDYVKYECKCPFCGKKVDGFQTKDSHRLMDTLNPQEVDNFYSICGNCKAWIDFLRIDGDTFEMIADDEWGKGKCISRKVIIK